LRLPLTPEWETGERAHVVLLAAINLRSLN
jgi:hypothetical protein